MADRTAYDERYSCRSRTEPPEIPRLEYPWSCDYTLLPKAEVSAFRRVLWLNNISYTTANLLIKQFAIQVDMRRSF